MFPYIVGAAAGWVIGCFTPGVLRVVKARLSSEASKGVQFAEVEVKKVEEKL